MTRRFDVLIIGTGTAASNAALPCAAAGLEVAVVDARAYGGTCARRGCQPKKFLVAAAEVTALSHDLHGRGIGAPATLDWPALHRSQRAFTDPVPASTQRHFRDAGITTLHGRARFTGRTTVVIEGPDAGEIDAATIVVATGARPAPLAFSGHDLLITSEDFLALAALPRRLVCVGGGFIALEFAHVAARAGVAVTVVDQGPRILSRFDADLVATLTAATREAGIAIRTGAAVTAVARDDDAFIVHTTDGGPPLPADLVLHAAGRVPALDDLDLDAADVAAGDDGIIVDAGLRSRTNPAVFAIGDACALLPHLAPPADQAGAAAAANIIAGRNVRELDARIVATVVFTLPPLASVGMTAEQAADAGEAVTIVQRDMSTWPTARRRGQRFAASKVMQRARDGRLLGAHVLGHGAADVINVFALAIAQKLTAADLQRMMWAYPTATSDVKGMVQT